MSNILDSIYNMTHLEDLAGKDTLIHRIHPLAKLLTTLAFLFVTVSFGRHEVGGLLTLFFYPVIIFAFSDIPPGLILKRILLIEPFIIGIGILNPLFEKETFILGGMALSVGWLTFLSIFVKCGLTVAAALLLIATTGMDSLAAALRMLRVPQVFVLQLLLTYRYISVLMEEVARMLRAYGLRSPGQKGIQRSAWGSFAGQLILRTYDRAQRVYQAMCVRGFRGEYHTGKEVRFKSADFVYILVWILFFAAARSFNLPAALSSIVTGVIK